MMVAMVVGLLLLGAAATVALSSRRVLDTDRSRTTVNQNLRSGMDLIGIDLRQAGERLPADVPALEIRDGAGRDTLVLRRNLLDEVLPLCADISAGTTVADVVVAKSTGTIPPGCAPVPDGDGDGWPDNMETWRSHRLEHGGSVMAYLYDPAGRSGEFFLYGDEDGAVFRIERTDGGSWHNDYRVVDQARVYILEERLFRLQGGILQLVLNGDDASPFHLVDSVSGFQVRAFLQGGAVRDAFGPGDAWPDLESVEIRLEGQRRFGDPTGNRFLVNRIFPRNILSR